MCAFPDIQGKVRKEIDAVFPNDPENILKQKHQLHYTSKNLICYQVQNTHPEGD